MSELGLLVSTWINLKNIMPKEQEQAPEGLIQNKPVMKFEGIQNYMQLNIYGYA